MSGKDKSLKFLKGVGDERAKLFAKLGLLTLGDLVRNFPRDYEDRTIVRRAADLIDGENATIHAMASSPARLQRISGGRELVRLTVFDDSGSVELYFFNQPYIKNSIKTGETYAFYGKISRVGYNLTMTNPVFEQISKIGTKTGRIVPIYRLTAKLNQPSIASAVRQALIQCADELPDVLPQYICENFELPGVRFAFENIHFPTDFTALALSRRRFIFEELFVLAIMSRQSRKRRDEIGGQAFTAYDFEEFFETLPFSPTSAQRRAIEDAARDCRSGHVMSRLVQGDVGSGKTLVAEALCVLAAKSGYQTAFMAPTELLAEQHFRTFTNTLEPLGLRVVRLTGGMTAKARRESAELISSGAADVVIGTHALISDGTEYHNLGLVITDEQHRFGVNQRAELGRKGMSPHVLVMSATPIPRTLALILYGDLDISVIDELPPGRQAVETFAVDEKKRERIYGFVRRLVSEGRQVYFVCPAVEEAEADDTLKRAKEYAKLLRTEIFPDLRVGLVHGSMKSRDKDAEMLKFVAGELDILVATTVIEVGVDVPNAALMVVENADRYGLSQLHQLRGRVGRGKHKSYCVLFEGAGGEKARERLKVLCGTNDGFEIAEADLRQRGPGDFFGSRQSGIPAARFIEMSAEAETVWQARDAAEAVLEADPELALPEHFPLRERIAAILENAEGTFS